MRPNKNTKRGSKSKKSFSKKLPTRNTKKGLSKKQPTGVNKRDKKEDTVRKINFSIVKFKTSAYIPLNQLNIPNKILMSSRYLFNKNIRNELMELERIKLEEEKNSRLTTLKFFFSDIMKRVPPDATDIYVQIDNKFLEELSDCLDDLPILVDYVVKIVPINRNILLYHNKIHSILHLRLKSEIFL